MSAHRKIITLIVATSACIGLAAGILTTTYNSNQSSRLHVRTFAPRSLDSSVQDIHCNKGSSTDRVLGVAKKQFDAACRFINQNKHLPWGTNTCGENPGSSRRMIVQISGKVKGNTVQGTYQPGPCAQAQQAWQTMSPIWTQPSSGPQSGVPIRMLVLPPKGEFKSPASWPGREKWLRKTHSSGTIQPCTSSLPYLDFAVCYLPQNSTNEMQITVRLTQAQVYALIKAKPEQVLRILRQAKQVPSPPGYPGYQPTRQG